jgi:hypothetical protein
LLRERLESFEGKARIRCLAADWLEFEEEGWITPGTVELAAMAKIGKDTGLRPEDV